MSNGDYAIPEGGVSYDSGGVADIGAVNAGQWTPSTVSYGGSGAGGAGGSVSSWINSVSGLFGTVFRDVSTNHPQPVLNRGIPGSPSSTTPVKLTGVGTWAVIITIALFVWSRLRH